MSERATKASIVRMASAIPLNKTGYQYLEPRPGSVYRELFVRGLNLRASRLVAWLEAEGLTAEHAAADRALPVEAVTEAIDYVRTHQELIEQDLEREHGLLLARGLAPADSD